MELLFVILLSFGIGLALRALLPGSDTYGSMLVPSIAAIVGAIVWESLTWAGWKFDGGWIWAVSLVAAGIGGLIAALIIPRNRRANDEELLKRLSTPSAAAGSR
jgi:hypothetical protein